MTCNLLLPSCWDHSRWLPWHAARLWNKTQVFVCHTCWWWSSEWNVHFAYFVFYTCFFVHLHYKNKGFFICLLVFLHQTASIMSRVQASFLLLESTSWGPCTWADIKCHAKYFFFFYFCSAIAQIMRFLNQKSAAIHCFLYHYFLYEV